MENSASISIGSDEFDFPVIEGTEGERAIDTRTLRQRTGYITFDEGYGNTGSCLSKVTFVDGEKGVLRYCGYPIEQLAEKSNFLEIAYLVIYGELPNADQLGNFRDKILLNANLHVGMERHFEGFPGGSHPMAVLSAMLNSLGCYYPKLASNNRQQDLEQFDNAAAVLISKVRTIAAMSYRTKMGLPFNYPNHDLGYCANFLHMMFSEPYKQHTVLPEVDRALNLFLLLHADHEQNCSTSTVRMVASGGANLFASAASGVCALWGPLHGGANVAVIKMLEEIQKTGDDGSRFLDEVKDGKKKLMGFGHRVYKNFDPRAKILAEAEGTLFKRLGPQDPLLDIARHLADAARNEDYFIERKLYPNVDFYSGIILKAIGIPLDMFTVMFAIGRMPGWIAHWKELAENPQGRIHRPRQIYTGSEPRDFLPIEQRG